VTVAVHHLVVWLLLPASVFNYNAQWWVVLVHAAFVVLETTAACYISREFFDNVIGLEKIVQARTKTINEKQRDMRLILDNVQEGLITIDLEGRMSSECSQVILTWFGAPAPDLTLAAWLGQADAAFGEWLALGLESVRDGMLPQAVTIAQLPARIRHGACTYEVHYQLVGNVAADAEAGVNASAAEKILVIITDISERLRQQASERHQAEMLQLFQHMMRDKAGFLEFLTEAEELMRNVTTGRYDSLDHLRRLVHTLKGNSSIFGMRRLAELCHEMESGIDQERVAPDPTAVANLQLAWTEVRADLEKLLGERRRNAIEIEDADYAAILRAVIKGVEPAIVTRMIESWVLEPTSKRLARIEQQIKGLAERMGKSHVSVAIEANDIRFKSEHFAPFWSAFIHVLRNVVDHGIENAEEREQRGKSAQSHIKVATSVEDDRFVVTVEDDGPGVDWDKLRARADQLGIAGVELMDREALMFLEGVSSKATVDEMSGRGVGMTAVREVCERLGGTIEVSSKSGVGTCIRFAFPKDQSVYEGHPAILRRAG
jgi:two-component system chemotaxis sensor kinase CheA